MSPPAARLTDMTACPMMTPGTPPIPHVGGPILGVCSPNVITGGLPQAMVGDQCLCAAPVPPAVIVMGSMTVLVNGKPAARIGDQTSHGGAVVSGLPTVLIGDGMSMAMGAMGPTNQASLAKALQAAAVDGKPFCEVCYQRSNQG